MSTLRFGVFEVDLAARALRKRGVQVRLQDQPFRVLEALLEKPGEIVTREELKDRLWAQDEFVEFDKSLNTAVQKIRQALGDSATASRFLETVPKVGYRFVAPVQGHAGADEPSPSASIEPVRKRTVLLLAVLGALALFVGAWRWGAGSGPTALGPGDYVLHPLTQDDGLTFEPTLSADGRWIAYASNRDGQSNLDIYVQQVVGGPPTRVTDDPADDHQPHFSPDGQHIVFRSERGEGGIYVVNALGTTVPWLLAEKAHGPRFSPDGSAVVFYRGFKTPRSELYVMPAEGGEETRMAANLAGAVAPVWTPDGERLLFLGWTSPTAAGGTFDWFTCALDGSEAAPAGAYERTGKLGLRGLETHRGFGRNPVASGWMPDSHDVLFAAQAGSDSRIWRMRFSADYARVVGDPEPITLGAGMPTDPAPARGRAIAFAQLEFAKDILGFSLNSPAPEIDVVVRDIIPESNPHPSLTRDGTRLAYVSRHAGQADARVLDLRSGRTSAVTHTEEDEGGQAFISPDGEWVTYRVGRTSYVVRVAGGPAKVVCEDCAGPSGWTPDSRKLILDWRSNQWFDVDTGKSQEFFRDENPLMHTRMSPDGRWLGFVQPLNVRGERDYSARTLFLAPLRGDVLAPREEWNQITDGSLPEGWGEWSADGSSFYYWQVRDDAKVLYRQALEATTKKAAGPPEEVVRFTEFDERLYGPGLAPTLAVAEDKIVFPMTRITGNIWIMEPNDAE